MRHRPRPFVSFLLLLGSGLLLLLLVVHLSAIYVLRAVLEDTLHPEPGNQTYVGDLHLNLFTGTAAIQGIVLGPRNDPYFDLEHLALDVDMGALFSGKLVVEQVQAATGHWRLVRRADGTFDPGFPLPAATEPDSGGGAGLAWQLRHAALKRFTVLYRDQTLGKGSEALRIDDLTVSDVDLAAAAPIPFNLDADWRDMSLALHGEAQPGASPKVQAEIDLQGLPIGRVVRLARQPLDLNGTLNSRLQLTSRGAEVQASGRLSLASLRYRDGDRSVSLAKLSVPKLRVTSSAEQQIQVDAAISLASAEVKEQSLSLSLAGLSGEALRLALSAKQPAAARAQGGKLELHGLELAQNDAQVKLKTLTGEGGWAVDLGRKTFSLEALRLRLEQLGLRQGESVADLSGSTLQLQAKDSPMDAPQVQGEVRLDQLSLSDPSLGGPVQLASAALNGLQVAGQSASLQGLTLGHLASGDGRLSLAQTTLGPSQFSAERIQLGKLQLDGLQAKIARASDGSWELPLTTTASNGKAAAPAVERQKPQKSAAPGFALAGLQVTGDSHLHFADRAIKPPLVQNLRIAKLKLGAMDSAKPNADTALALRIEPDKYTALKLDGTLRPLAKHFFIDVSGELSNLELALANGMVADSIGNRFLGGHLDDRFKLKIEKQRLSMNNDLNLQDLDVEAIEGKDALPLSTAVALLEDKQGRIQIDVPIDGDLNNPDFKVLAALNPIILKAVAGTAALAIQPVGSVLLLGGLLAGEALKVTFEPALFEPKAATLAKGAKSQLETLAGKLKQKPKLRLRLCGLAVEADRTKDKNGKYVESEEQLKALADQRVATARRVMLNAGVATDQLRSCRPKIDTKPDASPRVDIKL